MKSVAALASVLLSNYGLSEGSSAIATFSANGIDGEVIVEGGVISVDIDLGGLGSNGTMLPQNCTVGGMRYHLHTLWNYNDSNDRLGAVDCGAQFTGGHYDPWVACSSSSSNGYCSVNGGCVNGSSVLGEIGENTLYKCNESEFENNPYACEVGDWSGKYGYLKMNVAGLGSVDGDSAFEVDGDDVVGRSIVFHCNDNTRAFCAPFVEKSNKIDEDRDEKQEDAKSQQALFTDLGESSIILETNGDVTVDLNLDRLIIPENCGDYLYYRVYTDWETVETGVPTSMPTTSVPTTTPPTTSTPTTSTPTEAALRGRRRHLLQGPPPSLNVSSNTTSSPVGNVNTTTATNPGTPTSSPTSMPTNIPTNMPTLAPVVPINCSAVVGSFYDPTVTCATSSEHSDYCKGPNKGKLCGDTAYTYSCNATKDKFSCAPGDLSGKYGAIDLRSNTTYFTKETYDELMISLKELKGRSVVLQCSNTYEIVGCAGWSDYSGKSSNNNDNGIPFWVWIIVAVGAVILIAGAIFLCRRCRNDDDNYTKILN